MPYSDGYVFAVAKTQKQAFIDYAQKVDHLFIKHGALHVCESWADDVPKGETTDFYKAVKAEPDEAIVFSWVLWPDKAAREAGNEKVMADMKAQGLMDISMPFDGKRMIYGGFQSAVEFKANE